MAAKLVTMSRITTAEMIARLSRRNAKLLMTLLLLGKRDPLRQYYLDRKRVVQRSLDLARKLHEKELALA